MNFKLLRGLVLGLSFIWLGNQYIRFEEPTIQVFGYFLFVIALSIGTFIGEDNYIDAQEGITE